MYVQAVRVGAQIRLNERYYNLKFIISWPFEPIQARIKGYVSEMSQTPTETTICRGGLGDDLDPGLHVYQ